MVGWRPRHWPGSPFSTSAEEAEQNLRALIGKAEGLDTKLLAHLKGLQLGAFLCEIGVHDGPDPVA